MRKFIPPIASFLFLQGAVGVIAYFEHTTQTLALSIIATILGIGLAGYCYKSREKYSELSSKEMIGEIKYRKKYLPDISDGIARLINRIDTIAHNDERLVDLVDVEEYRKEYPMQGHFQACVAACTQ